MVLWRLLSLNVKPYVGVANHFISAFMVNVPKSNTIQATVQHLFKVVEWLILTKDKYWHKSQKSFYSNIK